MVTADQGEDGSKDEYYVEVQGCRLNVLANHMKENPVIGGAGFDQDPIIEMSVPHSIWGPLWQISS